MTFKQYVTPAATAALAGLSGHFVRGARDAAFSAANEFGRSTAKYGADGLKQVISDFKRYMYPSRGDQTPTNRRTSIDNTPQTSPFTRYFRSSVKSYMGGSPVVRRQRYRGFRRSGRIYFPKRNRRRYTRRRRFSRR